jgi:predicted RNA-binding protein with PIN domain
MADPTLYLFDGYNLLHAGAFADVRELRDTLASYVALRGARGVLVLDGRGSDEVRGPLEVRWAEHADALLERLAAEHRASEQVCVVSSDTAVRGTAGREVQTLRSDTFLRDMAGTERVVEQERPGRLADRLDDETRERLERLRRGES